MAHTKLELRPAQTEGRTRFTITGSLADGLSRFALHQLVAQLSYWTGERIDAVPYADDPPGWVEVWSVLMLTRSRVFLDVPPAA